MPDRSPVPAAFRAPDILSVLIREWIAGLERVMLKYGACRHG